ncbi:MAG: hypothetical protein ACR2IQ_01405 [Minisyncoccia bacterium]
MKIPNLFKNKTHFKKPDAESGIDNRPPWYLFLSIYVALFLGGCWLSYVIFTFTTSEKTGVYVPVVTKSPTVNSEKSDSVLNFFTERSTRLESLKTTKTIYIDPSI